MSLTRHFLGWDEPATAKVRRFLIPSPPLAPVELSDTLVIVPTRQAGRRLREALATHAAAHGTAVLSARVVTPQFLFRAAADERAAADSAGVLAVWADILRRLPVDDYAHLFPSGVALQDFAWALRTGELLQGVRQALVDAGLSMAGVAARPEAAEDGERWQDLARLEASFIARLAAAGMADPCSLKIARAAQPELPEGVRRVVVAAVPDPSLLAVRALESLAARLDVEVLVHAPAQLAQAFDEWGRPCPRYWEHCPIEIPDAAHTVVVAADPLAQARRCAELIAGAAPRLGTGDVALGVPDRGVIPALVTELGLRNITACDPADLPAREHPLYRLIAAYADLVGDATYTAVAAFLRHPDVLERLAAGTDGGCRATILLRQLDTVQNDYLPRDLDELRRGALLAGSRAETLARALTFVTGHVEAFARGPLDGALRGFLRDVYAVRRVRSDSPADRELEAVAALVDGTLRELAAATPVTGNLAGREALRLLVRRLGQESFHRDRGEADLELEGWLELPWNDAPLLIVTGLNDGCVPESEPGDAFLPDGLKQRLGLRADETRLARDAYLLTALIEARRGMPDGAVHLLAGKCSAEGDPLKPSRLLFRCADDELVARATQLLRPVHAWEEHHAASISFRLRPPPLADTPLPERLHVTAMRAYLACPFRFYLGHVLGMRTLDDLKRAPDALDFGTLVHAALQALGSAERLRGCADPEALAAFLCEAAEAEVRRRYGPDPALPVLVTLDSARRRLTEAAARQAELAAEGWELVFAEQRYECLLGGFTVRGKIDRIDRHRQTGAWRILDYKTGDKAVTPAASHLGRSREETPAYQAAPPDAKGKARRWLDLQLPLYALLAAGALPAGVRPGLAYFNLPKALGETGVEVWDDADEHLLASARVCAEEVARRIAAKTFWPPAERVTHDDFEALFPGGGDPAAYVEPWAGEA